MKGKRIEGEMHIKASADLEKSVEKDMEAKDPEGKSLAEFIDNNDGEDEDTEKHDWRGGHRDDSEGRAACII